MLERVVLGCIKVSTGKKGFSLFSTILVKIAQGHSTLAFTTCTGSVYAVVLVVVHGSDPLFCET